MSAQITTVTFFRYVGFGKKFWAFVQCSFLLLPVKLKQVILQLRLEHQDDKKEKAELKFRRVGLGQIIGCDAYYTAGGKPILNCQQAKSEVVVCIVSLIAASGLETVGTVSRVE